MQTAADLHADSLPNALIEGSVPSAWAGFSPPPLWTTGTPLCALRPSPMTPLLLHACRIYWGGTSLGVTGRPWRSWRTCDLRQALAACSSSSTSSRTPSLRTRYARELTGECGCTSCVPLYCHPQVMRRGIYVQRSPEGVIIDVREEATDIVWRDGCSLLHREVKKRGGACKKVRGRGGEFKRRWRRQARMCRGKGRR